MKKILALFLVFVMTLFVSSTGCKKNNPSTPEPEATPYAFASGATFGGFESNTLAFTTGTVTGTFSASNDAADGGTSPMPEIGLTGTDGGTNGSYMLALTATVTTAMPYPATSGIHALDMAYTNCGYVTLVLTLNNPADLSANNNMFVGNMRCTNSSGLEHKTFFYNSKGQVAYSTAWMAVSPVFAALTSYSYGSMADSSTAVPAGSSYTAASVVTSVTKIEIVFRYLSTSALGIKVFTIFADDFRLYTT